MAINRWLGVAQAQRDKKAFTPSGITPGSVWKLRIGSQTYPYTYPATIEVNNLTENDKAETVVNGLIEAYQGEGTTLGGGSSSELELTAELYNGKWALMVQGAADGRPLDVDVTGEDPSAASVAIVQFQAGTAAANHIQRIKVPGTPTAGNIKIQFRDATATVAYNASAATVEAALEALSSIGVGNVSVSGSLADGWSVEFQGTFAGQEVEMLNAWSEDIEGVASYTVEKTVSMELERQTYDMDALDGDANHYYAFGYDGDRGHLFSAASGTDAILEALESVPGIGAGNAAVGRNDDGSYTITLIGDFVGVEAGDITLYDDTNGTSSTLTTTAPEFGLKYSTWTYRIKGTPSPHLTAAASWFTIKASGNETGKLASWEAIANIQAALDAATPSAMPYTAQGDATAYYDGAKVFSLLTSSPSIREAAMPTLDVSNLKGCYAIDVRTTQEAHGSLNEIQQISIATDPTAGTFTLTYGANTTAGIAYNASAATLETALTGLASIGASNAEVSGPDGGPWLVEFIGALANTDVNLITGSGANLTLPTSATITETAIQTPTGPNWYTNALNWSLGHVPTNTEIPTFDRGSVGCQYGIDSVPAVAGLDVYRTFGGDIGLPEVREDGTLETLDRFLSLSAGAGTIPIRIGLGDEGNGPGCIRINTGSQDSTWSVLYTQAAGDRVSHTLILAGTVSDLNVSEGSVGVAIAPETSATVDRARLQPTGNGGESSILEWGENATVSAAYLYEGTLRAGSIPGSIYVVGGEATLRGSSGTISTITVRNSTLRYLAGGNLGKQGTISALTTDGSGQALLTSNGHGLEDGSRVYVSGVVGVTGIPDAYYTVSVASANTFALVGTAPAIPYGAVDPATVDDYYEANTAKWGLADAITVGDDGAIDFSEVSVLRTLAAPVLMQSVSARVRDPQVTIADLRLRHDPGAFETDLGVRCVVMRDEYSASTATPGNPGEAGGLVINP